MVAARFNKDPDAILDYGFDWTPWLDGDVIETSTWTVEQDAGTTNTLTTSNSTFDPAGGKTTIWLSGGETGDYYTLTNEITTGAGRLDDRTLGISIRPE